MILSPFSHLSFWIDIFRINLHIQILIYIHIHTFFLFRPKTFYCYLGFPGGSVIKDLSANAGDTKDVGLNPGLGKFLEEEMATHSSILVWVIPWTGAGWTTVHGVTKSWARWALILIFCSDFIVYYMTSVLSKRVFSKGFFFSKSSEFSRLRKILFYAHI